MSCDLACLSRASRQWSKPLTEVVRSLFVQMLGLPIEEPERCRPLPRPLPLAAMVHITGAWNGSVVLCASERLVREAAMQMLGCSEEAVRPAELHDTLAELVNIVGGGVKALVPGPSRLSLPMVLHGRDYCWQMPHAMCLACQALYCKGQPMTVRLFRALSDFQPVADGEESEGIDQPNGGAQR
jgi:CheY-specific phosphatase CheX